MGPASVSTCRGARCYFRTNGRDMIQLNPNYVSSRQEYLHRQRLQLSAPPAAGRSLHRFPSALPTAQPRGLCHSSSPLPQLPH